MKRHLKKYTSLTHYIEFLRKQPDHVQHVYAIVFAGSITSLVAVFILYTDYGFWHERFVRDDLVSATSTIQTATQKPESPSEMLSRFFGEARARLQDIDTPSRDFFKGKETYTTEGN